ncbi:MAG: hypothetical protein ACRC5M_06995, partial [Anaeroplasmataceae bacterium]
MIYIERTITNIDKRKMDGIKHTYENLKVLRLHKEYSSSLFEVMFSYAVLVCYPTFDEDNDSFKTFFLIAYALIRGEPCTNEQKEFFEFDKIANECTPFFMKAFAENAMIPLERMNLRKAYIDYKAHNTEKITKADEVIFGFFDKMFFIDDKDNGQTKYDGRIKLLSCNIHEKILDYYYIGPTKTWNIEKLTGDIEKYIYGNSEDILELLNIVKQMYKYADDKSTLKIAKGANIGLGVVNIYNSIKGIAKIKKSSNNNKGYFNTALVSLTNNLYPNINYFNNLNSIYMNCDKYIKEQYRYFAPDNSMFVIRENM